MAGQRKVCVITSTRADYGLLSRLMGLIRSESAFALQVIATGMHLSPEFGLTYQEIEQDGFTIDAKVEMLLSSDTPVGIAKSIGLGVIGFADAFHWLQPDIVILLGDRYEILAAAQAALVARIPVAHIAGGDTTEGAIDESIRHAITKMSHVHFVTNTLAAGRLRQMGENPAHIYNVGSPGVDRIKHLKLLGREELENGLDFKFRARNLLITFHPATLDMQPAAEQFQELLKALAGIGPDVGMIFTYPNADTGGRALIRMIEEFTAVHKNARGYVSLGQRHYLSVMAQVDAVVGNSSSGLYEAPSLQKPTVNIGDRQKGRLQAASIINCPPESPRIIVAIKEAFHKDCSGVVNPYGDGNASARILAVLKHIPDYRQLLQKHFYEVADRG